MHYTMFGEREEGSHDIELTQMTRVDVLQLELSLLRDAH
jgi:hypothetical protein